MEKYINSHFIILKSLVGSKNYNTDIEDSDEDYKYFIMPTFDELYNNHMYKYSECGGTDYVICDIRKLPRLLYKSNINFIETIFSIDMTFNVNTFYNFIEENRYELARMNLPALYNSCRGMSTQFQKIMLAKRYKERISKKFFKVAYQAFRTLDFLERMYQFNFDFQKSIWYDNNEEIINIRTGKLTYDEILTLVSKKEETVNELKEKFMKDVNEQLYIKLLNETKEIIRSFIKGELEIWT